MRPQQRNGFVKATDTPVGTGEVVPVGQGVWALPVEHGNRVGEGLLEQRDLSDPPRRPDLPMTDRNLIVTILFRGGRRLG